MLEHATIPPESEDAKVESWRLHVLIEAGFPTAIAEKLAHANDVDLHRAVDLLRHDCTPDLVAAILL